MRWKETLYSRRLRRPIDSPTREAINQAYLRRRHEIPVPTELHWHAHEPRFTIRSALMSFVVRFTPEVLVVDAELTLAAKVLATKDNRASAVRIIEAIAEELGL
jgi:hypothetical protein